MTRGAVAAVLVLLAVLAAAPGSGARLRRALAAPRPRGTVAMSHRRWSRPAWRRRRSPVAPPTAVARASAELATLLRAGALPATAWACLGEVAPGRGGRPDDAVALALRSAARAAAAGGDVPAALTAPPAGSSGSRPPAAAGVAPALAALAAAWRVAERTGAPTADVLDRLAASLRADADAAAAREAAMAAPRATARVLVALPPAGLLLGAAVGADPLTVLTATGAGRACAVVGVAATAAGALWTRALVRAAGRAGHAGRAGRAGRGR